MAIFAFCDIRQFTNTTEALQERVMLFVNDIAKIVHGIAIEYLGIPNKNIGDAFLILWKIPKSELEDGKYIKQDSPVVNNTADLALITIIKIIIKMKSEQSILKYMEDPDILHHLGRNYQVKLGFGLHTGIAIEGALGTDYKIDATYLSRDVEFTSDLEALTKVYGCPFIFSGDFHNILSAHMK